MLNKQKQIEIIIDELKKLYQTTEKINKLFNAECDRFESIYNIGFYVIPAILGINTKSNGELDDELGDLLMSYCWGDTTKKEYFNKIDKYTKKEPNHD